MWVLCGGVWWRAAAKAVGYQTGKEKACLLGTLVLLQKEDDRESSMNFRWLLDLVVLRIGSCKGVDVTGSGVKRKELE